MRNRVYYTRHLFWAIPLIGLSSHLVQAESVALSSKASPTTETAHFMAGLSGTNTSSGSIDILHNASSLQTSTVSGRVTGDNNEGLPGVSIQIKGTTQGTVTDMDGNFSLEVPGGNARLIVSYVGYLPQEIAVNNRSTVNITLRTDTKSLDEVVVVGYGTQKRGDVTAAVATLDAKAIEERPLARVDQALVGQMAGVRVQQTSGVPGRGFSIQVRGSGSISAGDQPLYVIDGFPLDVASQSASGGFGQGNPLDNINPNDIESIQVLKDASAAAIYGSRGANGVVIITTKSGRSGKPRITFNTYAGWNEAVKKLDVLSGEEWIDRAIEMVNYNWVNSGPGRTADQTTAERTAILGRFSNTLMPDERWLQPGYPGLRIVDWQDEIFRKGLVQNYQVTASGGTDAVQYFVSGDYLNQEGIAIGVGYERYSARANVEVNANNRLKFGLNLNPSYSIANDPGVEGKDQQMHIAVGFNPVVEDTVGLDVNTGNYLPYQWGVSRSSPVRVIENSIGETKIFRTLITLYGEYSILDDLRFRSTVNLDHSDVTRKTFTPSFVSGQRGNRLASGGFDGYRRQTFVNENTLSYDREINDKHQVSAVLGASYNLGSFNNFQIRSAGGFRSDDITTVNGANNINVNNTFASESQHTLLSYFGRVQYNFSDRYLFSATIRRDGSSRFGSATKWGTFPSASIGWRISEENFMENVGMVNDLKLRASWGVSGNNAIGNYDHISLLTPASYSFGGTAPGLAVGQAPANFPNPNIGWEESRTVNIGLDVGLLENRIFTSFDYYTRTNSNLLLRIPVPTATGFSTALTNIGEVYNTGWELELTTRNLTGPFGWTTNANLSFNKNEVRQLGPNNTPIQSGGWGTPHRLLEIGQPLWSIYVVQQDGILTQADLDNGVARYGNQTVGDPRYVDANKDGVINDDDRVIVGKPNPDYVWGLTNTFTYKGFDLRVLVQGQTGGQLYSLFGRAMDRPGQGLVENTLGLHRDRWRSPENPGAGERGKANSSFGFLKSDAWLYSSDYWRVRNITLGYDLGKLITNNLIQGARIYVSAENWFGGDKYEGGFNPEAVNNADSGSIVGDDYGAFPLSKAMTMGLNITF
ncbi:SusC/RagA family TonB-linked outer membrane protein [Pontibacter beigongshangensis]|uniref:SusC/RagA family TonB-linked outer membrane protein n=1 Tax=Pontibacter beigongshangensis TaxID=2574733 RepID=UPI0019D6A6DA|nr:TonB-dependent receptor [Pontibacter beigongshangensis]